MHSDTFTALKTHLLAISFSHLCDNANDRVCKMVFLQNLLHLLKISLWEEGEWARCHWKHKYNRLRWCDEDVRWLPWQQFCLQSLRYLY